ncbi:T9SS type B sorting domain-containing protein [Fulvivirga sp. M361]|uniref:beta strand repeat-containing protein n=1 Tax=Fulvivirga sp. M361 TaxID=2594266 RepID=UPI00117A8A79|nr:Calx-beta domain-containing protein [Fulvivirga sp. M361]TRX48378.1 T9SS type B sorting domain-containing protein [Fulvivirga sp. M361]
MKLAGILALTAIFFSVTLNAQTMETEPNGAPAQSGVITVPTTATIQGNVCLGTGCPAPDPVDFWHITDGSGGAFRAAWSANVEVTLREYPTSARNTVPSNTVLTSGNVVTLNASRFYSVSVRFVVSGVLTHYSVKLGNNPPTARSFILNDSYQGLSYIFTASQFGYSDADGDPLSLIRITSFPGFTAVYIDANDNDTFELSERVAPGETIPKAEIDAGNFQLSYSNNSSVRNFRFEVFDGFEYSAADYNVRIVPIPIPTLTLAIDDANAPEQIVSNNFVTATLSNAYGANTTVDLSFSGTATNIADYTRSANSIIIPAGSTTGTINLNNVDDALFEDDETVIVDIASVTNGNESGTQQVTYTILDDDGPELSIAATTQAAEDATDGLFTVSTSRQFATATNVTFTVGGTALSGIDYTSLGTSFTFPANTNSVTLTVPVIADNLVEADETVIVTLTGTDNANVTIGATDEATVTIADDDVAALSIVATTPAAEDGTNGLFTISTTKEFSAAVTVNLLVTGTATAGTDYSTLTSFIFPSNASSTTLPVVVLPDNLVEANETVIVTMTGTNNPSVTIGATDDATISIIDNDVAVLSIAATTQAAEDATDGLFTITATHPFSTPVTVDITVGGSATQGTDYATIGTQVVFPANQNTVTIPIDITADNNVEANENVVITLTGTDNGDVTIGASDEATVTITDDDVAELSIVATTQAAEDATHGLFTVSTSGQFAMAINVTFTVGGNATSGTDYSPLGTGFTFPANTNSTTISVPVLADNLDEADETVMLTLTGTDNAAVTIGTSDNATVIITDDDETPVVTPSQLFTVDENEANGTAVGTIMATDSDAGTTWSNWAIVSGNTAGVFSIDPPSGQLSIVDNTNLDGVTASYTLSVTVSDGTNTSLAEMVTVNVNAVNDAPGFTPGADQTVTAGAADYTIDHWATAITAGPEDEAGQTLIFNVTNDNATLFSTPPAISASGDLTFSVAAGVSGAATVSVNLSDDGGTANGGEDTSDVIQFTITVEKQTQMITFETITDKKIGQDPFALVATGGTSGNPVMFSITTVPSTGVATLANNIITLEGGIGSVTVTATQEGSDAFEAADPVSQTFNVVPNFAFLPTLFTPNRDEVNDRFVIRGGGAVTTINFSILDRESNTVYTSNDWNELSQQGWDGTSAGKEQPAGTYIWVVKGTLADGSPLQINGKETGIIRLLR